MPFFIDVLKINELIADKEITFGNRVLLILEQQKRSKSWLANEIGLSKQAINYLLYHSSSCKHVNEIATALEVRPEWLLSGEGSIQNYSGIDNSILQIPIIPFNDIHLINKTNPVVLTNSFTHLLSSTSTNCFATTLENPSMEPLFNRGTLLIFDSLLKPKNADYVIFSINKDKDIEINFRQYFIDGKDIYLKAIDTMYKSYKNDNLVVHGTLIESRNHFK